MLACNISVRPLVQSVEPQQEVRAGGQGHGRTLGGPCHRCSVVARDPHSALAHVTSGGEDILLGNHPCELEIRYGDGAGGILRGWSDNMRWAPLPPDNGGRCWVESIKPDSAHAQLAGITRADVQGRGRHQPARGGAWDERAPCVQERENPAPNRECAW